MCAIVGFSFYWIRRRQYELFLILHIGLSILVLITMLGSVLPLVHTQADSNTDFPTDMYPSFEGNMTAWYGPRL